VSAGRTRTRSNGASQEGSLRQTAGGGADGRGAWWQRFTSKLQGRFKRQTFSLSPALDTMTVDKNVFPRTGRVCVGIVDATRPTLNLPAMHSLTALPSRIRYSTCARRLARVGTPDTAPEAQRRSRRPQC
jgi:hypothetical protein